MSRLPGLVLAAVAALGTASAGAAPCRDPDPNEVRARPCDGHEQWCTASPVKRFRAQARYARCLYHQRSVAEELQAAVRLEHEHLVVPHDKALAKLLTHARRLARLGAISPATVTALTTGPRGLAAHDSTWHFSGTAPAHGNPTAPQRTTTPEEFATLALATTARRDLDAWQREAEAAAAPAPDAAPGAPAPQPPSVSGEPLALARLRAQSLLDAEQRLARAAPALVSPHRLAPADPALSPREQRRIQRMMTPTYAPPGYDPYDAPDPRARARAALAAVRDALTRNPASFAVTTIGPQLECLLLNRPYLANGAPWSPADPCGFELDEIGPLAWLAAFKTERYWACLTETPGEHAHPAYLAPRCPRALRRMHRLVREGSEPQWLAWRGGARRFIERTARLAEEHRAAAARLAGALAKADRLFAAASTAPDANTAMEPARCLVAIVRACQGASPRPWLSAAPWRQPRRHECLGACRPHLTTDNR